jgi:UDP-N-acetylglucosamine 2-epimerase (non-hydrolysing)
LEAVARFLSDHRPDLVLGRGDTTTIFATAFACYARRIPFGHVEAGLRTARAGDPFPEEKNRELISRLATLHFAPTPGARSNLIREGIDPAAIHLTGNPVIDALYQVAGRDPRLPIEPATSRLLLVAAHRRESFDAPLESIAAALVDLVYRHRDLSVVFPVHPDPHVRGPVAALLGGQGRIHLIEPVGYASFVALMKASSLIVTDSGGVQEEAPALGKPVLVLRAATERPEAVAAGATRLVGTRRDAIVAAVEEWLADPARRARSAGAISPYGDGRAAERIARVLAARFGIDPGPPPPGFSPEWPSNDGDGDEPPMRAGSGR